jgi:hypothetical protein
MGRINTHQFAEDIFDPTFGAFGWSFNDVFRNNYSSNFRSNFGNQDTLLEFLNLLGANRTENKKRPPTSTKAIKSLKSFLMSEKYCKKSKDKTELPNCPICISDIKIKEETILLPCGHMYHSKCVIEWLKQNNTCPVCRFELPIE